MEQSLAALQVRDGRDVQKRDPAKQTVLHQGAAVLDFAVEQALTAKSRLTVPAGGSAVHIHAGGRQVEVRRGTIEGEIAECPDRDPLAVLGANRKVGPPVDVNQLPSGTPTEE